MLDFLISLDDLVELASAVDSKAPRIIARLHNPHIIYAVNVLVLWDFPAQLPLHHDQLHFSIRLLAIKVVH